MNVFVTFRPEHAHVIHGELVDSRCVAILPCDSVEHGQQLIQKYFGANYLMCVFGTSLYNSVPRLTLDERPRTLVRINTLREVPAYMRDMLATQQRRHPDATDREILRTAHHDLGLLWAARFGGSIHD